MNNLERRIERLEETLGVKREPRVMIITNVNFNDGEEDPYTVQLVPGLRAHAVRGGPFTTEEIRKLREEYKEGRTGT